jgi:periplasmic protein TonB
MDYFARNSKLPAIDENDSNNKVFVQFVVEKDGSLTNIKVLRGINDTYNQEVIRLMQRSPKWQPAMINGKPVRCMYTMPISYQKTAQ